MIKIAFDARKYGDYGIGTYIRALIDGFAIHPSKPSLTVLCLRDGSGPAALPREWSLRNVPYRPYSMGEFLRMGSDVRRTGCDLFHAPHYTVPLLPGLPVVVSIQDLIHLRFPSIFSPVQRAYARFMVAHALRTAQLVITPSESTKNDLISMFKADEKRIKVIPLGVEPLFRPEPQDRIELVRQRMHLPERYVLFTGNPKPHKGMVYLLQAMKAISGQFKDLFLVIAGGGRTDKERIQELASGLGIDQIVRVVSGVPMEDLPVLYSGAEVFAMPSLWEGFGLPVLEAMACGVPIVSSNAGSLPEVVGDAGVLVQAADSQDLAAAMTTVLLNPTLRSNLRERGIKRSATYTWTKTVEATLAAYRSVI